jgi:hypothetical protein
VFVNDTDDASSDPHGARDGALHPRLREACGGRVAPSWVIATGPVAVGSYVPRRTRG